MAACIPSEVLCSSLLMAQWTTVFEESSIMHISFVKGAEKSHWDFVDDSTLLYNSIDLQGEEKGSFLVHDQSLAIAYWCIPILLKHSLSECKKILKQKDWIHSGHTIALLVNYTSCLLCFASDCYSAWGARRRILLQSEELYSKVKAELYFVNLVLTKNPKSAETWSYRKWMLKQFPKYLVGDYSAIVQELEACKMIAEQYPRNYYAWTYRLLVSSGLKQKEIEEQLDLLAHWSRKHVSDHCAYHYRHMLWKKYISRTNESLGRSLDECLRSSSLLHTICYDVAHDDIMNLIVFWKKEFEHANHLNFHFPGHEAIWAHRRILFLFWTSLLSICPSITIVLSNLAENTFDILCDTRNREIAFADRHTADDGICSYEKNSAFALAYRKWIRRLPE